MPDQPDQTAAELLRKADEIERIAKERIAEHWRVAHAEAEQLRAAARIVSGIADQVLRSESTQGTFGTTDMETSSLVRTPRGRSFESKHPLALRAKELKRPIHSSDDDSPSVMNELQKKFGRRFPKSTIRSWYVEKTSGEARPIPHDVAEYFSKKPWGIPLSAWTNGIKGP